MSKAVIMIAPDGEVALGWDLIKSIATTPTDADPVDATTIWCRALIAARSAALEEAAAEMEHREQIATTARDSFRQINSPSDATRQDHYRVAYGSAAAAIRELKDK